MFCTLAPITEFSAYVPAWDAINSLHYENPLLESRFISKSLDFFGSGGEKIALLGDPSDPVGIAIISASKLGAWSTFQASQSPLGAIILEPGVELLALTKSLFRAMPQTCQIISITQQDPCVLPRPREQSTISTLDYINTARITIEQCFEHYWAGRGKNLRHNLKRQRNRLERDGVSIRLEMLSRPEDMREGVKSYGDLESKGWKAKKGTAVHPDNEQGDFYVALLEDYASNGKARIYRFYYNDVLVAVDLCVSSESSLVILKTTYDESVQTSSPALLMRREYFPPLFDLREVKRIEFYGKVMDWHTKWSDEIRTMYHINAYRSAVGALLHRRARV